MNDAGSKALMQLFRPGPEKRQVIVKLGNGMGYGLKLLVQGQEVGRQPYLGNLQVQLPQLLHDCVGLVKDTVGLQPPLAVRLILISIVTSPGHGQIRRLHLP